MEQRIEALNRQLVELEASQTNPEQEKLMTQLATMWRFAGGLEEVGRTEESNGLKSTARELGATPPSDESESGTIFRYAGRIAVNKRLAGEVPPGARNGSFRPTRNRTRSMSA